MNVTLSVLLIEDNAGDALLVEELLSEEDADAFVVSGVNRLQPALTRLAKGGIDVVLLDLSLPDCQGLATFAAVHALCPALPVVIYTGLADEGLALRAMQDGAQDYLLKGDITGTLLRRTLRYALERHRQRNALAQSQRDFMAVIERNPDGVAITRGHQIIYANPALAAIFAAPTPASLVGQTLSTWLLPVDGGPGALDNATFRVNRSDDASVVVEAAPTRDIAFDGGAATLVVLRDITTRHRLIGRLMTADRLASVGTLTGGVAHAINNPLSYVITNLGFIAEELSQLGIAHPPVAASLADMGRVLAEAREGAERVRLIVHDLKCFANADSAVPGPVNLAHILALSCNLAGNEIRHRARLSLNVATLPPVSGNEAALAQALLNLVLFAAQSIPEGDASGNEIAINACEEPTGVVRIEIRDTGVGLDADKLAGLFEPLSSSATDGSGVALAVAQHIIHALGGQLHVHSGTSRGKAFVLTLPAVPLATSAETFVPYSARPGRRGVILVIDDEPLVGAAVRRACAAEHDVVVATSARGGLRQILAGERFDIILCDLMMPDMSGMELYDALLAAAPAQVERLIFLSGGAFTPRARAFLAGLRNWHLDKPFEPQALSQLMRDFMDARAQAEADPGAGAGETPCVTSVGPNFYVQNRA